MKARILSLNIGTPALMQWGDQSVSSSMHKYPVPGPLKVFRDHIEGNSFANPAAHGHSDSILYAYGLDAAEDFARRLGLAEYTPGSAGETVLLDHLDEHKVSVGDIFHFGDVIAQAVYPRIPCGKVNIRFQHERGQRAMQECGRSGIYFRILQPGLLHKHDEVKRVETATHRFLISDLYRKMVQGERLTSEEKKLAIANGAFPAKAIERWRAELAVGEG